MTIFTDDLPVAAMKRGLAAPGQFSTDWPGISDQEVADYLADGFASARLGGWFPRSAYDADAQEVTPDLSEAGIMLCVNYAVRNVLRQRLLRLNVGTHFKAGPVEATTTPMSNVLVALLSSAENEIDLVRRQTLQRVHPRIGDLTAIRLLGAASTQFFTTEVPQGIISTDNNLGPY